MAFNVHKIHKAYYGRGGRGGVEGGKEVCIKMGSGESHLNVSVTATDQVTRQCPQTTTFLTRKESRSGAEPRPFSLLALLTYLLLLVGSQFGLTGRPNWLPTHLCRFKNIYSTHFALNTSLIHHRRIGSSFLSKATAAETRAAPPLPTNHHLQKKHTAYYSVTCSFKFHPI